MKFFDLIQAKLLILSTLLSIAVGPFFHWFETYVFNDWDFLGYLTTVLIVDTVTGFAKHYRAHTVSNLRFMRVFVKIGVCLGALMVTHALSHFDGGSDFTYYFETLGHSSVMVYISLSALRNIHELSGKKLPIEWFMKRFEITPPPTAKKRQKV